MAWLIREDIYQAMARAHAAGFVVSVEQQAAHEAKFALGADGSPRVLKIADGVAHIHVEGTLTKKPDIFAWLFGGGNSTYTEIEQSFSAATVNASVKSAVLHVDSPGGSVDGLFDCIAAIQAFKKPLSVVASMACSAAYGIAAVAGGVSKGGIEATNDAAEFGSIGVAARYFVSTNVVDITSTEAPDKRPDVRTEEGKKVVQKNLDDLHQLFAEAIASGRKTTVANVNSNFGRGGLVLAREARKLGMIDRIAKASVRATNQLEGPQEQDEDPVDATGDTARQENTAMNRDEFKAKHPELFAAVYAEGEAKGVAKERDRVVAHLTAGEMSGDMKTASESITSGTEMTLTLNTKYMMAAANRGHRDARQADSDAAGKALDGAKTTELAATGPDLGDQVVAILDKNKKKVA